jgi:hypothetical protein
MAHFIIAASWVRCRLDAINVVGLLAQHFCPCTMRSRFSWLKKSPRPT